MTRTHLLPLLLLLVLMLLSACTAQDGAGAIDAFGRPTPLLPRQLIDPAPQQSSNNNGDGDGDGDAQATDGLDSAEEPSQSTRMSTTTVEGSSTSLATTTVSDPSTDQPPQDSETSSSGGIDSSGGSEPSSSAPTTDEEPTSATDNTQQSTSPTETDDQATAQTSTVDEDPITSAGAQPSPSDSDSDSDSTSPDKQAKSSDGLSGGAIAGIVVGVVVGVALIAGGIMLLLWHRRRKSRQASINGDFDSDFPNYHPGVLPPAHGVPASANNNHGAGTAAEHTGMTLPSSYSRPNQQQQQPMVHLGDGYINDTYAYQSQNHFNQGFTRQSPPGHDTYNGYL
ncbi:hypothetical protein LPJ57_000154 [Coemansia sp. RSA 486]|nr:hypothetical protein LPJ57_000154 [Coemansia sp. RSA 486]KAJ2237797.1 hypothetical protein IWW45_000685 [Coemansia sp. RSA 485]KAJ2639639.1 hypothetical protein GGF40_000754 [Coemansia sp. RSA 1286]